MRIIDRDGNPGAERGGQEPRHHPSCALLAAMLETCHTVVAPVAFFHNSEPWLRRRVRFRAPRGSGRPNFHGRLVLRRGPSLRRLASEGTGFDLTIRNGRRLGTLCLIMLWPITLCLITIPLDRRQEQARRRYQKLHRRV